MTVGVTVYQEIGYQKKGKYRTRKKEKSGQKRIKPWNH